MSIVTTRPAGRHYVYCVDRVKSCAYPLHFIHNPALVLFCNTFSARLDALVLFLRMDALKNTMYFKCCVLNCASTREDAILHKFPTDENRLSKWLQCLNDANLQDASTKNLFVCHKHFEKKFVGVNSRLRTTAYPTLFTSDEIASGIPNISGKSFYYSKLLNY